MDRGLIVLARPGVGEIHQRLVANLLLFDLLHAAKARQQVASEERRPFWVFLDEVQSYDGTASGNLAALLEQSAKFGLRAVVMNQNPERLNPKTLTALTTNRSHLLATTMNAHAAALLTKEWAGKPDPAALTRMGRFRFIAQVTDRGELSEPFALEGVRVEDVAGEPPAPERGAARRGGRPHGGRQGDRGSGGARRSHPGRAPQARRRREVGDGPRVPGAPLAPDEGEGGDG